MDDAFVFYVNHSNNKATIHAAICGAGKKLSEKDIAYFKSLKENEIDRCPHTKGRWIRNNWKLGIS